MRVIVSGRLKSRSYETKEGEKRTVVEMDVDEIGPSLRYATAKVNKTQRGGGGGGGFGGGQGGQRRRLRRLAGGGQAEDPWATGGFRRRPAAPAAAAASRAAGATPVSAAALLSRQRGRAGAPSAAPSLIASPDPLEQAPVVRTGRTAYPLVQNPSRGTKPRALIRRRAPRWQSPLCASPRRRPTR